MNKKELITKVSTATGKPQVTVEKILDEVTDQIAVALVDGGSLMLRGFGTFEVRHRASRIARNPHTGEAVPVPATKTVKFRVSRVLKVRVAGK